MRAYVEIRKDKKTYIRFMAITAEEYSPFLQLLDKRVAEGRIERFRVIKFSLLSYQAIPTVLGFLDLKHDLPEKVFTEETNVREALEQIRQQTS